MSSKRLDRVRARMADVGVDTLLLSAGPELPWLTEYKSLSASRERLTMLVVPIDGDATFVVPAVEAPRVHDQPDLFRVRSWTDAEDPIEIVTGLCASASSIVISDQTWSVFLLALQNVFPSARWQPGSTVTAPLREQKDAEEIELLAAVAAAVDRVANQLLAGDIPLIGRTETEVSQDMSSRIIAEGHDTVEFCIIGSGPNGASPHHEPGDRIIGRNEMVVCDFGGSKDGYNSDTTRTVCTGEPTQQQREVHAIVLEAQQVATAAATVGTPCQDVDAAARAVIAKAGYGERFIHRVGHGIGLEVHETPYMIAGNTHPIVAGNAFSVEPGIYLPGDFGVRIEDIVVATGEGPRVLNNSTRSLVSVVA